MFNINEEAMFMSPPDKCPHMYEEMFSGKIVKILRRIGNKHYVVRLVDDPTRETDCFEWRLHKLPRRRLKITLIRNGKE